ncbi:MAG TPA: prepilin-type N-terminal cleavage/methylation domain-containing protein [bacterium]|jgi:prepilin-type N-terminal cleavage/methylation domain-containing protein|nr:prepilin-type N-terminal cleavage/methylation domain-containing protein [bacterium]
MLGITINKTNKNERKGFTLIEMLVVVALIGILAGVVINVINIPKTQARSRDSKRIGDLKRIQTALELYFAENRKYPVSTSFNYAHNALLSISPAYIDQIPKDPFNGENTSNTLSMRCMNNNYVHGYYYISNSTGARYVITTIMELPLSNNDPGWCSKVPNCDYELSGIECGGSFDKLYCYCVQNPM